MNLDVQLPTSVAGTAPAIVPLVTGGRPARRFTVDEYHRMIETGILTENDRVELLDGWILEMSPIGPPHATCVALVAETLQAVLPSGWHIRLQSPITLQTSEPEPDITVVQGNIRDHVTHHPTGAEIALIVEVADSLPDYDRNSKRPHYAAAGIPEYWIVNFNDRQLEVYRGPVAGGDYLRPNVLDESSAVQLSLAGRVVGALRVADMLP
ncbi:MAG: Uma2 family endonuclease [Pirellulales bacterium]